MTFEWDDEEIPEGTSPGEVITGPDGAEPKYPRLRTVWERQPARARAVITAASVGVLALGGTVAYAATSGGSEGTTPAASSSSSSTSPDDRMQWFGLRGGAVHGEETVKDSDSDKWVVRVWQSGTVEKVDGDKVTVKSEDDTEWKWTVDSDTTVNRDGTSDSGADALKKGDSVYVTGRLSDDDKRTATQVLTGSWDSGSGWYPGGGNWRYGDDDQTEEGRAS